MGTDNKHKALVVDDSFLIRRLHKVNLSNLGFDVMEAENGEDGFGLIEEQGLDSFSLLVIDLIMPVMNGIEFIV